MPISYPLDPSGVSPANLVQDELHTVNEAVFRDYNFIVPNFAPFFIDNFEIIYTINGVSRPLVEDVDFSFALSYVTGTRTYGKAMYGGLTLHNLNMNGLLGLRYQTLGGDQVADRLAVLTILADKAYNPRTTIWDIVTNVPNALPPTPHYQDYDEFFGQEEVVTKLGEIRDAIVSNSSLTANEIRSFLENLNSISVNGFLLKSGGQMVGPLLLARPPIESNEAVTKQYVDSNTASSSELTQALSTYYTQEEIETKLESKVNVSGGTMTGPLILNAPPEQDMQAANKSYIDSKVTTLEGELSDLRSQIGSIGGDYISRTEVEKMIGEILLRVGFVS